MTSQITTGITFLDTALGSGQLLSGVHGLLGPIGGGKTTLGIMIAVEGAREQHARAIRGETSGRWILIGAEESADRIMRLVWSYAAKIDREAFARSSGLNESLTQYEQERANELPKSNGAVLNELERFALARPVIENFFYLSDWCGVDFCGAPEPINSLVAEIERLSQHFPIAGVVIDYVGLFVEGFIASNKIDWRRESGLIRAFVANAKRHIAERLSCPVWLIHQLTGSANQRHPLVRPTYLDAKECRYFGDDLDVCVALGTKDRDSGCFLLFCSKTPMSTSRPPALVTFDPNFAALKGAHGFRVSRTLRQIVEADGCNVECDARTRTILDDLPGGL